MKSKEEIRQKSAVAKRIKMHRIFFVSAVAALLAAVCLFTPLFDITEISVKGNRAVSDDAVIKASGIKTGNNVFRINTSKAKNDVCALGYVEKAEIQRKFPSKIVIRVTECSESAYILFAANYVGIDLNGKVISVRKAAESQDGKMTVTGISLKSFKVGSEFEAAKKNKKKILLDVFSAAQKQNMLANIKNINLSDEDNVKITVENNISVVLGKCEKLEYKLAYLNEVINSLDEKTRGGTVDLSDTSNVIYKGGN